MEDGHDDRESREELAVPAGEAVHAALFLFDQLFDLATFLVAQLGL